MTDRLPAALTSLRFASLGRRLQWHSGFNAASKINSMFNTKS